MALQSKLEFEKGKLVKVNGMRPEYLDGWQTICLVRELAGRISYLLDENAELKNKLAVAHQDTTASL
jgi:hypothetical protein